MILVYHELIFGANQKPEAYFRAFLIVFIAHLAIAQRTVDHYHHCPVAIDWLQNFSRMFILPNSEDLIGKSLTDQFHIFKIQNYGIKFFQAVKQALGFRAGNVRRVYFKQINLDFRFGKSKIIARIFAEYISQPSFGIFIDQPIYSRALFAFDFGNKYVVPKVTLPPILQTRYC